MTRARAIPLLALLALAGGLSGCEDRLCPAPRLACGDACVDPETDVANCGACGNACAPGVACVAGACECGPARASCDGACVELGSDPANCGGCGRACDPGTVCSTSAAGLTRCAAACDAGLTPCGGACVDLQADRYHCGACGTACAQGQGCVDGTCLGVHVACFSTDDVRTVAADFLTRAAPRAAGDGPIALAVLGEELWAATSLAGSLVRLPQDLAAAPTEYLLHGNDFEYLTSHQGLIFVAHSGASTLAVFDPAQARVVDEIPLVDDLSNANPKGIAFAGGKAYVSLAGVGPTSGQVIAVLDASNLDACATRPQGAPHCLPRLATLDVRAGADAAGGGLPFPGRSVAVGATVYVALANLKLGAPPFDTFYTDPAGPGRLAVIDSADDSLTYLSLGDGCRNPGGVAVHDGKPWVACGAFGASGLVQVDPAGPTASDVRPVGVSAPGNVAFCGPWGYVTDQFSGAVVRFAPVVAGSTLDVLLDVCPAANGFAWAADVACTP